MDEPKSLADPSAIKERHDALSVPHAVRLREWVAQLRTKAPRDVCLPDFDPFDGGVGAECLFLLEAPGAKAIGSGFVSRNNPDETAKNFFCLNREAGLDRTRTIVWNVVPWYVGDGKRIRPVTDADFARCAPYLEEILGLLPRLRVVVLVGRKAQRAERLFTKRQNPPRIFHCLASVSEEGGQESARVSNALVLALPPRFALASGIVAVLWEELRVGNRRL